MRLLAILSTLLIFTMNVEASTVTVHLPVMSFDVDTGTTVSGSLSSFQLNDTDIYNMTEGQSGSTFFDETLWPNVDVQTDWSKTSLCFVHNDCLLEQNGTTDGDLTVITTSVSLALEQFEFDDVPPTFDIASGARIWIVARANATNYPSVRISIFDSVGQCHIPLVALIASVSYVQYDGPVFDSCGANPLDETTLNDLEVLLRYQGVGTDALTITALGLAFWWSEPDYALIAHGSIAVEIGGTTYLEWSCVGDDSLFYALWNGSSYIGYQQFCSTISMERTRTVTVSDIFGGLVRFRLNYATTDGPDDYNFSFLYCVRSYDVSASESWGGFIWLVVIGTGLTVLIAMAVLVRGKRRGR